MLIVYSKQDNKEILFSIHQVKKQGTKIKLLGNSSAKSQETGSTEVGCRSDWWVSPGLTHLIRHVVVSVTWGLMSTTPVFINCRSSTEGGLWLNVSKTIRKAIFGQELHSWKFILKELCQKTTLIFRILQKSYIFWQTFKPFR